MSFTNDPALQANQLPISLEFPRDPERFYEVLTLWQKRVTNSLNTKEGALYVLQELYSFKQYFTPNNPNVFRNVYRYTYDMVALNGGPIAAGATVAVPHNIPLPTPTSLFNGVNIYGSATNSDTMPNGPKRMPLPYSSATVTRDIEIYLDNKNVTLINGATQSILTYATIVAEYLKN